MRGSTPRPHGPQGFDSGPDVDVTCLRDEWDRLLGWPDRESIEAPVDPTECTPIHGLSLPEERLRAAVSGYRAPSRWRALARTDGRRWALIAAGFLLLVVGAAAVTKAVWDGRDALRTLAFEDAIGAHFDEGLPFESRRVAQVTIQNHMLHAFRAAVEAGDATTRELLRARIESSPAPGPENRVDPPGHGPSMAQLKSRLEQGQHLDATERNRLVELFDAGMRAIAVGAAVDEENRQYAELLFGELRREAANDPASAVDPEPEPADPDRSGQDRQP